MLLWCVNKVGFLYLSPMKGIFCFLIFVFVMRLSTAQILTSSNLPIMIINTYGNSIADDYRIVAGIGIINNAPGVRNYLTDPVNDFDGQVTIEIRGSTSQQYPKLSYAFTPVDSIGNKIDAALLGLPAESDWVLYAPYSDKSLIRNTLAFYLARQIGHYTSRTRFVEVMLNGNYLGNYELLEKIKVDPARVDISELSPADTTGDQLTGGYIFKVDKTTGSGDSIWYSDYDSLVFFQYHDPDDSSMAQVQRDYIRNYVYQFETALLSSGFADVDTGYRKYADASSFIDFFLLQEMGHTVDGYRSSCFLHKDKDSHDGRIKMGPMWDFNVSYGNINYCSAYDTVGWQYQFNNVCNGYYPRVPFWWTRLLEDTTFQNQLRCRWDELQIRVLNIDTINRWIDSVTTILDESQQRNFQQWPILGVYVNWNYYVGATYEDEVSYLKTWIADRLVWMDNNIPGNCIIIPTVEPPATLFANSGLSLSPNPASDVLTIENTTADLKIFNLLGEEILLKKIFADGARTAIDVSSFASGIYFIHAGNEVVKFMKK